MSTTDMIAAHDDLSSTQEYTIAGIVIVFFGLLYGLFNYGFSGIHLKANDVQLAPVIATGRHHTAPSTSTGQADNSLVFASKQAARDTDTLPATAAVTTAARTAGASETQQLALASAAVVSTSTTAANAKPVPARAEPTAAPAITAAPEVVATTTAVSNPIPRVITDPAILKLRDHLLNGELEQAVLLGSVSFADKSEKAELSAETQVLDLAALLQQNPGTKILIRGHTTDEGSIADSKTLALARATALGQRLVAAGVAARHIIIMGMGDAEPLSSDNKQQNRGRNRRIDVAITQ